MKIEAVIMRGNPLLGQPETVDATFDITHVLSYLSTLSRMADAINANPGAFSDTAVETAYIIREIKRFYGMRTN